MDVAARRVGRVVDRAWPCSASRPPTPDLVLTPARLALLVVAPLAGAVFFSAALRGDRHGGVLVDRVGRARQRAHLRRPRLHRVPDHRLQRLFRRALRVRARLRLRGLLPGAGAARPARPAGRARRARLWLARCRGGRRRPGGGSSGAPASGTTGARGHDASSRRAGCARSSRVRVKAGWLRRRDAHRRRGRRRRPDRRARRDARLHRPERRRQVDHAEDAHRRAHPVRRRRAGVRARAGAAAHAGWRAGSASSSASAPSSGGTCRCATRSSCCATSTACRPPTTPPGCARCRRLLDLDAFLDTPVRQLSLGQRMRGELTAALLHGPEVLFLDEPTIGLDVVSKQAVRAFLAELGPAGDTTLVLTTHDLADIERLCRRLVVIDHGRVVHDGTLDELHAALRLAPPGGRRPRRAAGRAAVLARRGGGVPRRRAAGASPMRWTATARPPATWCAGWPRSPRCATSRCVEPDIEDVVARLYTGRIPDPRA